MKISRLQNVYSDDNRDFQRGKQSPIKQGKLPERKRRWIQPCSDLPSPPSSHSFCNLIAIRISRYARDMQSRLKEVTYPGSGNNSQFTYDGMGRCVKILETTSGSTTSTKQFVWCENEKCEERDGSGALTRQFYDLGEKVSGTNYFYSKDHLGSIREMTNASGNIQAQYSYDPYGQVVLVQGSNLADFQHAGYYLHQRSGLNLTRTRAYNAALGRWINRDPIEEQGGPNLYSYVGNSPLQYADPLGLIKCPTAEEIFKPGIDNLSNPVFDLAILLAATGNLSVILSTSAVTGPFATVTNITAPRSVPNLFVNVSRQEFESTLVNSGFIKTAIGGSKNVSVFTSGTTSYTLRTGGGNGFGASANVSIGGNLVQKIRMYP